MKIFLFFYFTFILSSCTFYYENICSSCDPKLKFLQRIVDSPENIDSIIINSEFYNKKIKISIREIISSNSRYKLENLKGLKFYKHEIKEIISGRFDEIAKKEIYVKQNHIGLLNDCTSDGIIAIFELRDEKWIISTMMVDSKDEILDYFENDGINRHTLY